MGVCVCCLYVGGLVSICARGGLAFGVVVGGGN